MAYTFGTPVVKDDHTYTPILDGGSLASFSTTTTKSIHTMHPVTYKYPINYGYNKIAVGHIDVTGDAALDSALDTLEGACINEIDVTQAKGAGHFVANFDNPRALEDGFNIIRIPIMFDSQTDYSKTIFQYQSVPARRYTTCKSDIIDLLNTIEFATDFHVLGIVEWNDVVKGIEWHIEPYHIII